MATYAIWCFFGILALTCAKDSKPQPEVTCDSYIIRSTIGKPAKQKILDDNGQPADIVSVEVIQSLSSTKCVLDKNVEYWGSFVSVTDGCQVHIKVCYNNFQDTEPTVRPGCKLARLLSRLHRDVDEDFESRIESMRVVRQFEQGAECKEGDNFGFKGKKAFAKEGCRADFEICLQDRPDPEVPVCKRLVLRSTAQKAEIRKIVDSEGNTASIVSVKLTKELSVGAKCVELKTFLYNDTHVTVTLGCVGRFEVCYVSDEDIPEPTSPSGCLSVRLLSTANNSAKKKVVDKPGLIKSITVHRLYSETKCILNKNFGIKGTDVYASEGCRADFKVCIVGQGPVTEDPKALCINVRLSSWGKNEPDWKKITDKSADRVRVTGIRLKRQESFDACLQDKTFSIGGDDEILATNGCKGIFRVCYVVV